MLYIDKMTDILNNIDFYKTINYNDIDFNIYKVKNKRDIQYFNNKDIFYSSPFGLYIILNNSNYDNCLSLLDLNKYLIENYNLY